ncbi:MAG: hypothetical protein HOP11_14690, partial [Saprospiraceae bacterium]|nr:hypothetical protein [Saprospiraceae bacterium]
VNKTKVGQLPLVADMDGDCIPEFIVRNNFVGGVGIPDTSKILIIDSRTGALKKEFECLYYEDADVTFAVADIDNDGVGEIIIGTSYFLSTAPSKLVCYEYSGRIKWISDSYYYDIVSDPGGPSLGIADFNQDGIAEIYSNYRIFNAQTGKLLVEGTGLDGSGSGWVPFIAHSVTVAAQLDQNPNDLELAAGYTVYKVMITNSSGIVGNSMTPININVDGQYLDGKTAVADINNDGHLDVVVAHNGNFASSVLYSYTISNNVPVLITKNYVPGFSPAIGISVISDIENNDKLNFVLLRDNIIFNFEFDGTNQLNLIWSKVIYDRGAYSGLTTFDLNSDGFKEIIHRGDSLLYVIDCSSGSPIVIDSAKCFSITLNENTVVADIDNTGQSKICTTCGTGKNDNQWGKLTIFGSPDTLPGWAPARGIWNQYAYNPLFINDDLTVPQYQKNQATYKNGKYNNFMQQESLLDSNGFYKVAAASLLGNITCINYDPLKDEFIITYNVINKKDASRSTGDQWYVTFYNDNPENGGVVIDSILMTKDLKPGDTLHDLVFNIKRSGIKQLFLVLNTSRSVGGIFVDKDFKVLECDYTDNISQWIDFPIVTEIKDVFCESQGYKYKDSTYTKTGKYYYIVRNALGCDQEVTILDLEARNSVLQDLYYSSCDSIRVIDTIFYNSGSKTYLYNTSYGCDSTIIAHVEIRNSNVKNTSATACDSILWNGRTLNQSGKYNFQSRNVNGCDSTTTLDLTINNSKIVDQYKSTCNSYAWNGNSLTLSGDYTHLSNTINGCDSTTILHLTIDTLIRQQEKISTCNSYNWNGILITRDGIYIDTFPSTKGCDSIVILDLTINQPSQSTNKITTCDSLTWNGKTYTQSGTYDYMSQNSNACDSIATLQLTINKSNSSLTTVTSCDSIIWNNVIYTQSGMYQYNTLNSSGCDSVATLNLRVNKSSTIEVQQTSCDSFRWNNKAYYQSGRYPFQTINSNGCDSIITLDLKLNASSTKDTSATICDSVIFLNKTLKSTGKYSFTIQNIQGCDSVINLNLKISSEYIKDSISRCGSYTWNVNGEKYESSGIYSERYTNRSGCDSIYQLNLTVHKNYEILNKAEVCKEYYWPVNKELYTQSGEYILPLKTAQGCDSILKLNLLVNPEYQNADTVVTTDSYTWPVNQKTYPTSGTYKEIYTTKEGCDSIHLLLLSINKDVSIYYPNVIQLGGLNSFFTIFVYGTSATIKTLSIYDRWGELIWQKQKFPPNELQQGWDGTFKNQKVNPGVFVWHAEIELKDGRLVNEKGDLTVLR